MRCRNPEGDECDENASPCCCCLKEHPECKSGIEENLGIILGVAIGVVAVCLGCRFRKVIAMCPGMCYSKLKPDATSVHKFSNIDGADAIGRTSSKDSNQKLQNLYGTK